MHFAHAAAGLVEAVAVRAAAVTPTPTPAPQVDPDLVTPGPVGFLAIAFIALVVMLLVWDMMRRIRRGRVRADINEQLDAEEQARREAAAGDGDASDTPDGGGDTGGTGSRP
jgi:hypothetical protein